MSPDVPVTTAPDDAELLAQARDAALGVSGVVALHSGAFGEVATYLPGARIEGLRRRGDEVEVHVVARYGEDLSALAERVAAAVGKATPFTAHVIVDDIAEK